MKIRKAIIPAAGLGIRLLPATKAQPKEMLPIIDKPALQYIVEEAVASGIDEILIITGRNKKSIEDHFDKAVELELQLEKTGKIEMLKEIKRISSMAKIHYVRQQEPKGLGHAICCAKTFIGNEPFAVLLGDDIIDSKIPCLSQLVKLYEEYDSTILGVQEINREDVNKYGIVKGKKITKDLVKIEDLVEKPKVKTTPSNIAIMGRYILVPRIFDILEHTPPGRGGEIQLTDGLRELVRYEDMYAFHFEGKRYDVGDKLGFIKATVEFALKRDDIRDDFKVYLLDKMKNFVF
ncbi:UTP--glucose-1-phosphate uridylyltransferase GalU [Geosporobacter ferrireducens]|uniref:UTP--glucose-1-phosphate uridylyltransferase n=1 Tax=Geosporobacter ferrireducens TaxID=1424294 RepID=A0A1D8GKU9_9FIRM|nr:UTP--glucose-1-phosphate uridylyltransferase GalU [Geosporobacter ferrireducens]AOT71533.1 UTP--glucose-1-phosphate uridylyltransferase [Geosporobacter ferrireducens]MTI57847.1 UTP--glucose-1-phosphate uridylyltransferase GalU [Geosporobacter ferrireducens]